MTNPRRPKYPYRTYRDIERMAAGLDVTPKINTVRRYTVPRWWWALIALWAAVFGLLIYWS